MLVEVVPFSFMYLIDRGIPIWCSVECMYKHLSNKVELIVSDVITEDGDTLYLNASEIKSLTDHAVKVWKEKVGAR